MIYCCAFNAPKPVGTIYLTGDDDYLHSISKNKTTHPQGETPVLSFAAEELKQYFSGKLQVFKTPIRFTSSEFREKCWSCLREIKYGSTISYKDQAILVGGPNYARAVAGANNKNLIPIMIPCHRVIGSDGSLVGFGWGLEIKQYLLDLEKSGIK